MVRKGKIIPAKAKWNNFTKTMMMGKGGFPDFIAFKHKPCWYCKKFDCRDSEKEIIGVECKINGRLDKKERAKCQWLIENNIFSSIRVVRKTKVKNRIVIEYKEFE